MWQPGGAVATVGRMSRKQYPSDLLGLVWGLAVIPASVQDWDAAREVLRAAPRLTQVFVDAEYAATHFRACWFMRVIIGLVSKDPDRRGFGSCR